MVEVIGVMCLLLESFPSDDWFLARYMNWRFRSACAKGTWCVLLVHVAALLSTFQANNIFFQGEYKRSATVNKYHNRVPVTCDI